MLKLTRKNDQAILIGDDILIVVSQCRNGGVNVLLHAPKDVPIVRAELLSAERQAELHQLAFSRSRAA